MPAARLALPRPAPTALLAERLACLGCPDCAGPCWSRFELSAVPDQVLHPRTPRA